EAAPEERSRRRARAGADVRGEEGAVEQEPGDDEEHGDAAVHPGEEDAEEAAAVRTARERDVGEDHGQRSERAQAVEARVATRRLGPRARGLGRRHPPDPARLGARSLSGTGATLVLPSFATVCRRRGWSRRVASTKQGPCPTTRPPQWRAGRRRPSPS